MKQLQTSVFLTGLIVLPIFASHAQDISLQTQQSMQVGLTTFDYKYRETVGGEEFMNLSGTKLGLTLNYTGVFSNDRFAAFDLRYANGPVTYTGSGSGNANDNSLDLRLLGGVDFALNNYTLSPFAGLGRRALHNNLAGYTTTGHLGYSRDSTYIYLPVGITHRFRLGGGRVATTFEYDHLLQGTQVSGLSALGASNDLTNTQRKGLGWRLGVAYEKAAWSTGFFYNYWDIADSDESTFVVGNSLYSGYEPQNTTKEVGFEVKYKF